MEVVRLEEYSKHFSTRRSVRLGVDGVDWFHIPCLRSTLHHIWSTLAWSETGRMLRRASGSRYQVCPFSAGRALVVSVSVSRSLASPELHLSFRRCQSLE